jgi:cystathionine beta-lyase/cystathionine gamma-synthase
MPQIKASSRRTPIYRDTGFLVGSIEEAGEAYKAEAVYPQSYDTFLYTRMGNPTVIEAEQAVAAAEGSVWAALTASGMAAIDVALSIQQKAGDDRPWLFFDEIYGGTITFAEQVLKGRRGVKVEWLRPHDERFDMAEFETMLESLKPQVVYFEAISNPLLICVNGPEVIRIAKKHGCTVIMDNTFCTPLLWKPLEHGADLVVHSATKYFSGHGDLTAGVVCGNDHALHGAVMQYRKVIGNILSPDDAYRLTTTLKTFPLRYARQCDNALKLARLLDDSDKVERVRYPGLEGHLTAAEAAATFGGNGFGAMVTFDLKGGRKAADKFVNETAGHIGYVMTLGDSESIMLHVATVFGEARYPFPGMFRFSAGFEPFEELEGAVRKALAVV